MKVLAAQAFNQKFSSIADERFRSKLLTFIDSVEKMSDVSQIVKLSSVGLDNIYVYRIEDYRLFFSIEKDNNSNDYLLLVDFITKGLRVRSISNNKNKNPRFNNRINPRFNNSINPRFNNRINPRFNNSINPRFNNSINPRFNNSINPRINASFDGFIVYDLDLNQQEFIVQANENVILFYNMQLNNTRFGIKHSSQGYVIFDLNNNWIGHLESDSQNGYNEFNNNNDWIRFVK
jgi:mRNA-degrading endonuclease RelE of RelBE toxin-antitoxin system